MPAPRSASETYVGHNQRDFDLVLVGAGLQNGLIALGVWAHQPDVRIALIESAAAPGGNHTWCIHPDDVPAAERAWVEPLIVKRWSGYDVRFEDHARSLSGEYAAIDSKRFAQVLSAAVAAHPGSVLFLNTAAQRIAGQQVQLADGRVIRGALVVDARGPELHRFAGHSGYQKFLGLELEFESPHGLTRPLLMDSCVEQRDGFRFFYVLPFDERRLLIEDTCFSRSARLDRGQAKAAIHAYAERFGRIAHVVRDEAAVLPMPWADTAVSLDAQAVPDTTRPLVAGYRGGFFHPATGYSFPAALRLACHIATRPLTRVFDNEWTELRRALASQASFARQLNRLLFNGFAAHDMWHVFARFYRLPEPLIHRFYAMSSTWLDRARIVVGRPPNGFSPALMLGMGAQP